MNMPDLLTEYGVHFYSGGRESREGWINLKCPYCEKNPYLGYNLSGRYFHCWYCGWHPLIDTLHLLTGVNEGVCKELAWELPRRVLSRGLEQRGKLETPPGVGSLSNFHTGYLYSRGFWPRIRPQLWGIKGIGQDGGMYRWRLFLPFFLQGEMVSWTTRKINDSFPGPRYLAARDDQSIIPIERLLYGIDMVRNSVIVCEGPLDAIAIGPGAVAVCGTRTSPHQLDQLSKVPYRAICFDREPTAQERARGLARDLSVFDGQTVNVELETGKDPSRASKVEIEGLRRLLL
jgi:hypothetical protein